MFSSLFRDCAIRWTNWCSQATYLNSLSSKTIRNAGDVKVDAPGASLTGYSRAATLSINELVETRATNRSEDSTVCQYHSSRAPPNAEGKFACCGKAGPGCKIEPHAYKPLLPTVTKTINDLQRTPAPDDSQEPKRAVVALDCEMVRTKGAMESPVRISAIDVLTGDILINKLVKPSKRVTQWRTEITGVRKEKLKRASGAGRVLQGTATAAAELFKYIDSRTILVGHALSNDLKALPIMHDSIIDTRIVAANGRGLKSLAAGFLGLDIQEEDRPHSALVDTRVAREVVVRIARDPGLSNWAEARISAVKAGKNFRVKNRAIQKVQNAGKRQKKRIKREKLEEQPGES